jgi:DeoR/GlpR family transcriptional regulator of sugar metabolism
MIDAARSTVVVADSSKFGHRALAKVADLSEIGAIITDSDLTDEATQRWSVRLTRAVTPD